MVIGSNPIRSDKCRSLAQFGLEHKYLKKPHKMLGWTSWLSHKIFILAFRSSNLLPSTKKMELVTIEIANKDILWKIREENY